jgi:hypothetical protein
MTVGDGQELRAHTDGLVLVLPISSILNPMISSPSPIRPLNVGNVVSAAFNLYRDHFGSYFGIAFKTTLWVLGPLVLALPIAIVAFGLQNNPGLGPFLVLGVVAWIVGTLFCIARYGAGVASITRLAYGELVEQPESPAAALRFTQSRQWAFLRASFFAGLIILAGYLAGLVLWFVFSFVMAIVFAMMGGLMGRSGGFNPAAMIGVVLAVVVGIGGLIAWLLGLYWLMARVYLSQVPLAIEANVTAIESVNRSWQLTQKNVWRLVVILIIALLITLPLIILNFIVQNALGGVVAGFYPDRAGLAFNVILSLISTIVGQLPGILVVPFTQSLHAVIYADLRSRREGTDLSLRDR